MPRERATEAQRQYVTRKRKKREQRLQQKRECAARKRNKTVTVSQKTCTSSETEISQVEENENNTEESTTATKKVAMSSAERQKAYRQRKKNAEQPVPSLSWDCCGMEQEVSIKGEPAWSFSQGDITAELSEPELEHGVQHITVEPKIEFVPCRTVKEELDSSDDEMAQEQADAGMNPELILVPDVKLEVCSIEDMSEELRGVSCDRSAEECHVNVDGDEERRLLPAGSGAVVNETSKKRDRLLCLNMPVVSRPPKHRLRCEVCGKQFSQIGNLKDHTRTHTGERPYTCSDCGKGFRQKSHLQRHAYTHGLNRPYKCDHCEKTFLKRNTLRTHLETHTREQPIECHDCGCTFSPKAKLNTYLITHTGTPLYKCLGTCLRRGPPLKTYSGLSSHRKPPP